MPTVMDLAGRRILVVEDDFLVADTLAEQLDERGATVIGPMPTLAGALQAVDRGEQIDGAVLDIRLLDEWVYPLADELRERGVPFVFATGYDKAAIEDRFADIPRCEKPVDVERVARALFG